ncbi:2-amino-4-hydroxy-6-hydroxymethyldihydropteridine pyrophosphokinase FolK [Thermosynechococcus sp. NK55a]|uniref:2-amino-4-hydroxy-6- hydroxymethyldihydropteridine diphosphokinase n=1 Tax=unclassified Thermosynechococcus TaxID=2622553 RepID=UPI0003D85187|nr:MULTISPECIES: 2-amino-4-hydroxy-6-hydroxymethyldihydropteridine diphosphokinase [unclassified Thermosynechococcus]AHB87607.1 2-amino-4-hydroxy-6-hydroxymethyldihydropteridine pyrophosphokinase FolK [Thermosynechococcus sp. NK55a]HIK23329.1 2-amino-4-hydroxy-6-hydroxymethyldihydropteridine diphosphokinase [Thermosynechococcus sp. M3746_W2019_013]
MVECADLSISPSDPPLVAIALGSNLGKPLLQLRSAVQVLAQTPGIRVLACSPWYRTAPLGPPQPDYWNGCLVARVQLSPWALLKRLQAIEAQFGRQRQEHWGARTLDLDLLLYGDCIIRTPDLTVPHPRLAERPFVLLPLAAIAPHWRHPLLGETIQTLRERVGDAGIIAVLSDDADETTFATAADRPLPEPPQ